MAIFKTDFELGDKVFLDGCKSIKFVITEFAFRGSIAEARISWVKDGVIYYEWLTENRLKKFDD
jgi:hypothetical protein